MKTLENEKFLLTEKKEVLGEVRTHFLKQFRKRNIVQEGISSRWYKAYQPIKGLDNKIYASLREKITEEEWSASLSKAKNKSSPGVSGISYLLIKRAGA
jgi:hypothetical protein